MENNQRCNDTHMGELSPLLRQAYASQKGNMILNQINSLPTKKLYIVLWKLFREVNGTTVELK